MVGCCGLNTCAGTARFEGQVPFSLILAHSVCDTHSLSLDLDDRWGTTVDVADSWVHRCRSLVSLMVSTGPSPVHLVMSSSHLLLCPPRLLVHSTVPCRMAFDSPVYLITWPYHLSLRFLTMDRSSSYFYFYSMERSKGEKYTTVYRRNTSSENIN